MNSYNKFTYIIFLVTNLYLFRSLVYGTEPILNATYTYSDLTLIADLFLFRSPVGHILILISHRTHTYSDSLYTVLNLYIDLNGGTYHVLILLSVLYLFRSPVGVTELMLIQRYLYTYWYLYLSQTSRRSLQNLCLYHRAYTYTTEFTLVWRYP